MIKCGCIDVLLLFCFFLFLRCNCSPDSNTKCFLLGLYNYPYDRRKKSCGQQESDVIVWVTCRFDTKYPICNMFKLFICAVCQVVMKPGEGISIHAGSSESKYLRPWDGPFLCPGCQDKKDAMEGKRSFGGTSSLIIICIPK